MRELFPWLMQGEPARSRKLPPARSTKAGSFVMLPAPLDGSGQVQQLLKETLLPQ
jgi:hypothetical protein